MQDWHPTAGNKRASTQEKFWWNVTSRPWDFRPPRRCRVLWPIAVSSSDSASYVRDRDETWHESVSPLNKNIALRQTKVATAPSSSVAHRHGGEPVVRLPAGLGPDAAVVPPLRAGGGRAVPRDVRPLRVPARAAPDRHPVGPRVERRVAACAVGLDQGLDPSGRRAQDLKRRVERDVAGPAPEVRHGAGARARASADRPGRPGVVPDPARGAVLQHHRPDDPLRPPAPRPRTRTARCPPPRPR